MSLTRYYKRAASVRIKDRTFTYPPFSIEFSTSQSLGKFGKTVLKLYNPAPVTIASCEIKKDGNSTLYPSIEIQAGYENNMSICVQGEVKKFDVYKEDTEKILEIVILEAVEGKNWWDNPYTTKSLENMTSSQIIHQIVGSRYVKLNLSEDVFVKRIVITDIYTAIKKIAKLTNSNYYFRSGILIMEPKSAYSVENPISLDYTNGLIETPEKIDRNDLDKSSFHGYKIKTFYLPQIDIGKIVQVKTGSINIKGKVENAVKTFSTFQDSFCEFEIRV